MHFTAWWQPALVFAIIGYLAVCFGLIARRYGRIPWLWGPLAVISPINLVLLGWWAATGRLPSLNRA